MSVNSDIRDGLVALIKQVEGTGIDHVFSAEVTAVDIDTRSCTVIGISDEASAEYNNVWLMPEIADGLLYVPKVGSTVIVGNNIKLQPYIVMWSELDQILFVVGNTTYSMTEGLTKFNQGSNDGLVNIKPLVQKINALESLINNLKTAVTAVVIGGTVADGGAVKAGILAGLGAGISPITQRADLEDTTVTH